MVRAMSILAAALLLLTSGTGPAGSIGAPALVLPLDARTAVGAVIADAGRTEDMRRLSALFSTTPTLFPSRGLVGAVRLGFVQPFAVPEIANAVTQPAAEGSARPYRAVARYAARAFGIACTLGEEQSTMPVADPQGALFALDFLLNESNLIITQALTSALGDGNRERIARAAIASADSTTARAAQIPDALSRAMQSSASLDRTALVRAAGHFDTALAVSGDWKTFDTEALPAELAGAVDGTVLSTQLVPEIGWLVIGGSGANRYDMTKIAAVFDIAGDDRYEWGAGVVASRLVIDIAGNDS